MSLDWNVTALFTGLLVGTVPVKLVAHQNPVVVWILRVCGLTTAVKAAVSMLS